MKRFLTLLCAAALAALVFCLAPTVVLASEVTGECGDNGSNITYVYDTESFTLTLTGTGATKDFTSYGAGRSPFVSNTTIKNNCKTIVIGGGITRIGDYTFNALMNVTSITFPSTLESVGYQSFASMNKMSALPQGSNLVTIGEAAFAGWSTATELDLPDTVVTIGKRAFNSWKPSTLTIPASVRTISDSAFSGWTNLETLVFEEGVETIGANAFASTMLTEANLPASLTSMDATSFNGNNLLAAYNVAEANTVYSSVDGILYNKAKTLLIRCPDAYQGEVVIAEECTEIGGSAFDGCAGVNSVVLPQNLVNIGGAAFSGTSITSITIPETVTELGAGAFAGCSYLTEAVVNADISVLPQYLFNGCSALETVTIGEKIGGYGTSCFQSCSALTNVTAIQGADSIPDYCFYMCSSLAHFDIPDSVTYIGNSAFAECGLLEEIVIPEGVTSIGMYAFQYCTSITELTIPAGVTSLPGMMCQFCSSLREVTVLGDLSVPTTQVVGNNAFGSCTSLEKIWFKCPCPSYKVIAPNALYNTPKALELHYLNIYPEWDELRPFDQNNNTYNYVSDLYATEVRMIDAELRARPTEDSLHDIRFIAMVVKAEGSEVTRRYVDISRSDSSSTLTVDCNKDFRIYPDGSVMFTVVITGIKPRYDNVLIGVTAHVDLTGVWEGTWNSETLETSVNILINKD